MGTILVYINIIRKVRDVHDACYSIKYMTSVNASLQPTCWFPKTEALYHMFGYNTLTTNKMLPYILLNPDLFLPIWFMLQLL
jgi:hypothetical protein